MRNIAVGSIGIAVTPNLLLIVCNVKKLKSEIHCEHNTFAESFNIVWGITLNTGSRKIFHLRPTSKTSLCIYIYIYTKLTVHQTLLMLLSINSTKVGYANVITITIYKLFIEDEVSIETLTKTIIQLYEFSRR